MRTSHTEDAVSITQRTPLALANLIVSGYLFKVTYEVLATPATYAIVNFLKRSEGADTFDRRTNFNPFRRPLEEPGLE